MTTNEAVQYCQKHGIVMAPCNALYCFVEWEARCWQKGYMEVRGTTFRGAVGAIKRMLEAK